MHKQHITYLRRNQPWLDNDIFFKLKPQKLDWVVSDVTADTVPLNTVPPGIIRYSRLGSLRQYLQADNISPHIICSVNVVPRR